MRDGLSGVSFGAEARVPRLPSPAATRFEVWDFAVSASSLGHKLRYLAPGPRLPSLAVNSIEYQDLESAKIYCFGVTRRYH